MIYTYHTHNTDIIYPNTHIRKLHTETKHKLYTQTTHTALVSHIHITHHTYKQYIYITYTHDTYTHHEHTHSSHTYTEEKNREEECRADEGEIIWGKFRSCLLCLCGWAGQEDEREGSRPARCLCGEGWLLPRPMTRVQSWYPHDGRREWLLCPKLSSDLHTFSVTHACPYTYICINK